MRGTMHSKRHAAVAATGPTPAPPGAPGAASAGSLESRVDEPASRHSGGGAPVLSVTDGPAATMISDNPVNVRGERASRQRALDNVAEWGSMKTEHRPPRRPAPSDPVNVSSEATWSFS